ncbi:hypothetical protein EV177_010447, partial [Coemansia sp. RSA 1804]
TSTGERTRTRRPAPLRQALKVPRRGAQCLPTASRARLAELARRATSRRTGAARMRVSRGGGRATGPPVASRARCRLWIRSRRGELRGPRSRRIRRQRTMALVLSSRLPQMARSRRTAMASSTRTSSKSSSRLRPRPMTAGARSRSLLAAVLLPRTLAAPEHAGTAGAMTPDPLRVPPKDATAAH